ncbi:hypothetical protein I552_0424 [Mycobacterium xenopi 3993]|nr:hypothetical protein I552_0424 [Mycobacterium xenopi 3993]
MEANQLAPEIWRELSTLDRATADTVAVTWSRRVCSSMTTRSGAEPCTRGRARSGRIAAIREAVGIAAYHCGDWPKHSPSCAPPAGWAASPRCFR